MPYFQIINCAITNVYGILLFMKFGPKFPLNVSEYSLRELKYSAYNIIPTYSKQMNLKKNENFTCTECRPINSTLVP